MLRRKLISIFIKQILGVAFVLLFLAIIILIWMFNKYENIELKQDFAPSGIMKFIDKAEIDEDGQIISSEVLEQLELDGGWIQSLDVQGKVIQSFNTPENIPTQYNPVQLIDYWLGASPFPYALMMVIQQKENYTFTLLYGKTLHANHFIQSIIDNADIINHDIILTDQLRNELLSKDSWIQVFNANGNEISSWNKPAHAESQYTLQELALRNKFNVHNGIAIESYYDEESTYSWVVQYPVETTLHPFAIFPKMAPELELMLVSAILFIVASLIVLILLALLYTNKFMRPIMDIVLNIEQLGQGKLSQPEQQTKNKRKHRHKLFAEVFESIQAVGVKINESKEIEKQTHIKREEWIAGITHDMKTPLSSIKGYAHMLATDKYEWTEQDIKQFAAIMIEKSEYMNQLLDDLALTYQLSNKKLPIELSIHNVAVVLYDAVQLTKISQLFTPSHITLKIVTDDIFAMIHPPWMERIVYNLVANALLHNSDKTEITIELRQFDNGTWSIVFTDNGNGMDEQTMARLFDRYYRGTNTEAHIEGSGLGMAITKQLVQAMNGHIEVSSELGNGTSIILSWHNNI